jgi:hypothetical protein
MQGDTKLSLLMKNMIEFYKTQKYVDEIKSIIDQENIISLRILDWFITNYSKKYRTYIKTNDNYFDVYMEYKLMLRSYSKKNFDPFCRKNKIEFYYTNDKFIETSCGQLSFFKWCFQNGILPYVKSHLDIIEKDMKQSLKLKKNTLSPDSKKRQPLSIPASRSISKIHRRFVLKFD